jgi:hypothetical protein
MRRQGRPPAWTNEEQERVLALADEGVSQRAIAEQVFGDARYRGRVERILRERAIGRGPGRRVPELSKEELDAFDVGDISLARELVARWERALAESEEVPDLAEIERLLRIKRQIAAAEMLQRANAIARGEG